MAPSFAAAVELVLRCGEARGRVVVTGMGKSGIIAQKIAATLSSTGTPALFLHPAEAVHGDLGMLTRGDLVLALSASGETEEILRLGLAPTASTTAMLALGDALAIAVSLRKGFRAEDFAQLHPGGKLGKKLAFVRDLMHAGDALPAVAAETAMSQVIYEMSRKKLGVTTVLDSNGRLLGIISDGDLRRLLESRGPNALALNACDAMNPDPRTIAPDELAARGLAIMEERRITSLVVTNSGHRALGILHLHDLWGLELI
jgi:arabinose-5-phosphate isomerase